MVHSAVSQPAEVRDMSSFTKTFPPGTLVIRTDLTVTSIVSKKPGEKIVCDALVGMDIITQGDFHLTNDGKTVFSFNIPPEKRTTK